MAFYRLDKYKQNLKVDITPNKKILYSYDTPIIEINHTGDILKIYKKYNYSVTTVKHLNYFLQKFTKISNKKELENIKNFNLILEV